MTTTTAGGLSSGVSDAATLAAAAENGERIHTLADENDEDLAERTHSYLPYTNHPTDLAKMHHQHQRGLYYPATHESAAGMDETSTYYMPAKSMTATTHHSPSQHRLGSMLTTVDPNDHQVQNQHTQRLEVIKPTLLSSSLTDLRRQQQKPTRALFRRRVLLVALAILAMLSIATVFFVCWPRTPRIKLTKQAAAAKSRLPEDATDWGQDEQHPWLRTAWAVNVTLDNRDNLIPTHLSRLDLILADQDTQQPFARSYITMLVLPPREETQLSMIFDVDYETSGGLKDPTFEHLYNACGPQKISNKLPPALNVTLEAVFEIVGVAWKPSVVTVLPNGFRCPNN